MLEYKLGYFATSLCGHDKGRLYMIVEEEGEMVGLCDGVRRCLANPKKKKKKHIQMMRSEETAQAFLSIVESKEADSLIRNALRAAKEQKEQN
ncbi:MAG: hypothetical protein Q4D60_04060 [Eubacteriales bacterium]|nr:hypothetical protein [Eubacteriales bacterium]